MIKNNNFHTNTSLAKSSFLLVLGGLICKFLGAFYRIPLSNILGAEGMGIYQILFPLYSFSLVFVSGGLTFALSKLVAKQIALNKEKDIFKYFVSAFCFVFVVGVAFFLIFVFCAGGFESLQKVEGAKFSYYLIGGAILFSGFIACFRGLFQGYNNMSSTMISQIIEQVVKLVFGLGFSLLFLSRGLYWAVFGAFLGLVLSEVFAFLYYLLLFFVFVKKKKIKFIKFDFFKNKAERKELFKLSFPVMIASLMLPFCFGLQGLLIVKLLLKTNISESLAKSQFGILSGMVNSLISFPAIVGVALAVVLVPSISFLLAKKQNQKADTLVKNVYKTLWVISLPCVFGFFMLSENILEFIFFRGISAELLPLASLLLKVSSLQILFMGFVQVAVVLLQVLNKTWQAVLALSSFVVVNIILTFVLTLSYGIVGLAIANVVSYAVCLVVCLFMLKNKFNSKLAFKEIFMPLLASVLMVSLIVLFKIVLQNKVSNLLFLIIVLFVSIIVYFSVLILFKIIKKEDFIKEKIIVEK